MIVETLIFCLSCIIIVLISYLYVYEMNILINKNVKEESLVSITSFMANMCKTQEGYENILKTLDEHTITGYTILIVNTENYTCIEDGGSERGLTPEERENLNKTLMDSKSRGTGSITRRTGLCGGKLNTISSSIQNTKMNDNIAILVSTC